MQGSNSPEWWVQRGKKPSSLEKVEKGEGELLRVGARFGEKFIRKLSLVFSWDPDGFL